MNTSTKFRALKFRADIQALRALAVISVIGYHFKIAGFSGGFLGVDVFFVISGYLIASQITGHLKKGDFSFYYFFVARIRRIFPALAVMCLGVTALLFLLYPSADLQLYSRYVFKALVFISNRNYTRGKGYFDARDQDDPFLHTWSLSIEGQFYVLIVLLVYAAWRFGNIYYVKYALSAAGLLSLAACLKHSTEHLPEAFYFLHGRLWELMAGSLAGITGLTLPKNRTIHFLTSLAWLLLPVLVYTYDGSLTWPGIATLPPVLLALICITGHLPKASGIITNNKAVQFIGDASYSLYLWHWPVWVIGGYLGYINAGNSAGIITCALLLTLALATMSYYFVETPFRKNVIFWTPRKISASFVSSLALFLSLQALVSHYHGFPQRFPDYVARADMLVGKKFPMQECIRDGDSWKREFPYCTFGSKDKADAASVFVWGDSHANQWIGIIDKAITAQHAHGASATYAACPVMFVTGNDAKPAEISQGCWEYNRRVTDYLEADKDIKIIVMGQKWVPGEYADDALGRFVDAVKHEVLQQGRYVVMLGAIPAPGHNVPRVWAVKQITARTPLEELTIERSHQSWMDSRESELKTALSTEIQNGKVIFIPLFPELCNQDVCWVVRNGKSLYSDDNHISEDGLSLFQDRINAEFAKLFFVLHAATLNRYMQSQQ